MRAENNTVAGRRRRLPALPAGVGRGEGRALFDPFDCEVTAPLTLALSPRERGERDVQPPSAQESD